MISLKESIVALITRVVVIFSSLILIPLIINQEGIESYGKFAFLFSVVNLFLAFDLGISAYIMNNCQRNEDTKANNLRVLMQALFTSLKFYPFLSIIFFIGLMYAEKNFLSSTFLLNSSPILKFAIIIGLAFLLIANSLSKYFFAIGKNNQANIAICLQSFLGFIGSLIALNLDFHVVDIVLMNFLFQLIFGILCWICVFAFEKKRFNRSNSFKFYPLKLRDYVSYQVLQITAQILLQAPTILIAVIIGERAAGEFTSQWKYLSMPMAISGLVFYSVWKKVLVLREENTINEIQSLLRNQTFSNFKLAVGLLPFYIFLSGPVIETLSGNLITPDFLFVVLCGIANSVFYVIQPLAYGANGLLRQKRLLTVVISNVVLYTGICLVTVSIFGLNGMVIGITLTHVVVSILIYTSIGVEDESR